MTSPFGHAQFEASAAAIETFLARTYLVPERVEYWTSTSYRLLSRRTHQAPADAGGTTGGTIASIRCGPGSA